MSKWKDKEFIKQYSKEWYAAKKLSDIDYAKKKATKYRDNNRERSAYLCAKARAKAAGVEFSIEESDVNDYDLCPVFNVTMQRGSHKTMRMSPSIDRIDPSKGYVKGNVQVISKLANSMKQDASPEELLKFADWVYKTYKEELVK
jgi:hypothetical protein